VDLKIGDVLKLNTSVKGELDVFAENVKKFGGRPGVHAKKKAILITKVFHDDETSAENGTGGK
jgi:flagellar motor switch protein FliM